MRYNTGNPVGTDGSSDPRDLYDNAGIIDLLLTGQSDEALNRLGVPLKSWAGIMQQVTDYLLAQGYESVYLTYGAGVVVARQTQLVQRSGELYRVMSASDIPLTLTGNWTTDAPKLQAVGDAALRQALSSSSGATMLGYNGGTAVQTVKDRLGRVVMATDYTFIKAACDANLNVLVPPGTYSVTTLITVRDNQTITFMPGAILQQNATGNAGIFTFPAGVKNVLIQGPGALRGPAYGRTPVPNPVYPASNGCIRILGTAANPVIQPQIIGVTIEGWDDYGIFCENATGGARLEQNIIRDTGRDGIRIYGGGYGGGSVRGNRVNNISPGFGGVAPNLNVYGITFTRRADAVATPTVTNPPPRGWIATDNIIWDCPTWKGLDTHGGQDLIFENNIIWNCHIGIGIDEGDTVGQQDSPPRRIKVTNNNIYRGNGNLGGAGINISSSSATNMGTDNELTGNTIRDFGGVGTGGINSSYQDRLQINGGHIIDCRIAGINIPGSVRMRAMRINGPTIVNTLADGATPALAAIAIQAGETDGCISGATFVQTTGTMFGFSIPTITSGYALNIGGEISTTGTVTRYASGSIGRISGGTEFTGTKAVGRVTTAGALATQTGLTGITKVGTGIYELTTAYTFLATTSMFPNPSRRGSVGLIWSDVINTNTFRVYTANASGTAADAEFSVDVKGI